MNMIIREFKPTEQEYEAITAISNALFPDYARDPGEWRHEDEGLDKSKYIRKRYVVEETATGSIVGWGEYRHRVFYFHPRRFWIWIEVHPDHQRKGIGSRLYDQFLGELAQLDPLQIQTNVSEQMPESIAFLTRRGFREAHREWESRVDPQKFDPQPFRHYVERMGSYGIQVATLAQLKESDPDWLPKLYDLHTTVERDAPSSDSYTPPSQEYFLRSEIEAPASLPDAFFVAVEGDRYIGESYAMRDLTDPASLYQGLTGVRREHRGKGIALALKVLVLEYAKSRECSVLKTWNSTLNQPMLAINGKLGFVGHSAWIELEKRGFPLEKLEESSQ
jgi:GNAT superfamily N-acetyltransferase